MHPLLPEEWDSKALRVAMSSADWERFEALVDRWAPRAETRARAYGLALSQLLRSARMPKAEPGPLEWMDWERRKTLRLLVPSSSRDR